MARVYDRALALDPANAYVALDALGAAARLGDVARARAIGEGLVGQYPRLGPAWSWLGHLAKAEGRQLESRAFFQNAVDGEWHGDEAGRQSALDSAVEACEVEGLVTERERLLRRWNAQATVSNECP